MKKQIFTFALLLIALATFAAQPIKIGEKAPAFSLKGVDGKTVSLSDYNDQKGVVLIFTCNTCPYAVAYQDRIIELHNQYAAKGFPVVAVNSNNPELSEGDSFEEMKKRSAEKKFPYPYLFDEQQTVFPAYGASKTPEVFILKKSGNDFEVAYTGTIDDNYGDASDVNEKYVGQAIESLLAGKTPDPATTKAIGCGIKSKK